MAPEGKLPTISKFITLSKVKVRKTPLKGKLLLLLNENDVPILRGYQSKVPRGNFQTFNQITWIFDMKSFL